MGEIYNIVNSITLHQHMYGTLLSVANTRVLPYHCCKVYVYMDFIIFFKVIATGFKAFLN